MFGSLTDVKNTTNSKLHVTILWEKRSQMKRLLWLGKCLFYIPGAGETIPGFFGNFWAISGHFLGATLTQFAGIVRKGYLGKAKKAYARDIGYSITWSFWSSNV